MFPYVVEAPNERMLLEGNRNQIRKKEKVLKKISDLLIIDEEEYIISREMCVELGWTL